MIYSTLLLPVLAGVVSAASNDWKKPCTEGECFYDLKTTDTGAVDGSMRIWGSPNAIADITTAAGWEILGCDGNALEQDIRLVCVDPSSGVCDNLFQSTGATGKVVRLPENCGAGPFAVVSRAWIPQDQSLPEALRKRLVRRQGEPVEVQALALGTDFAAVDPAVNGDVNVEMVGSNLPGNEGDAEIVPVLVRRSSTRVGKRGFSSFIKNALNKFNSFDKELKKTLPPIKRTESLNIANLSVDCPASDVSPIAATFTASADVTGTVDVTIDIGVVASGRIIPPKIDEFALFAGMTGSFDGTLDFKANARGQVDSGLITLFQTGIPGISFPGIITVGPSFKLDVQASASLEADVNVQVALNYKVDDAKLFFPAAEDGITSGGGFSPADSPLKISIAPSASTKASIEARLIPTVDFGISAIGGFVEATVFLNLEASAKAALALSASVDNVIAADPVSTVNGCFELNAALAVNAGATADFFGLFNPSTEVSLFQRDFEILKRCFGDVAAPTKREIMYQIHSRAAAARAVSLPRSLVAKRVLTCTSTGSLAALFNLVDETVPANAIVAA